jgi:hypothetical protein
MTAVYDSNTPRARGTPVLSRRDNEKVAHILSIGTEVGGRPDAYPVKYEILALRDGVVLKLTDALGQRAEVALGADDTRVLALGLLGALPAQPVSGLLGADNPPLEVIGDA